MYFESILLSILYILLFIKDMILWQSICYSQYTKTLQIEGVKILTIVFTQTVVLFSELTP